MTRTWADWEREVEQLRHNQMEGDFARGQRAPVPRTRTELVQVVGTFAAGQRQGTLTERIGARVRVA